MPMNYVQSLFKKLYINRFNARLFLLISFVFIKNTSYACGCDTLPGGDFFCNVISISQNNPGFSVVKVVLSSPISWGVDAKVLDVYYGNIPNDTIRIWGDNSSCCRPTFNAPDEGLFYNDTFILAIEKTDLCGNTLAPGLPDIEDAHDYMLPGCGRHYLSVKGNLVIGSFFNMFPNPEDTINSSDISALINNCISQSSAITINEDQHLPYFYPNPAQETLYIDKIPPSVKDISIKNMVGITMLKINRPSSTKSMNVSMLLPGLYIIEWETLSGNINTRILLKQ